MSIEQQVPKTPKYIVNKRKLQNYETMQQALLIGLLNPFCQFIIKKPRKQTIVRHCMPKVKTIKINDEEIEVMKLADHFCRPLYEEECRKGMNKQTAFRRFEKNKKIFVINILYDLCLEMGYFFDARLSRKTEKSLRIDRIQRVYLHGEYIMDVDDLMEKGELINDYLNKTIAEEYHAIISLNDTTIRNIFCSCIRE
ncbi:hypothetical protein EDI_163080 [Entamoeba dispar SAW760]|uniref:Uncharacterized protein n=1 Tax=Entamoeba dispar (strain ATCC PRA-260 / SAW760) TaxID=370354 RepID=B0ECQ9_ENTDS|nr:uncharacterized protein EDI_163080 [Entamoeba dispar SAW760]EDR27696.1 hypothetical protein EDI_163080 [Entamoeba dispar SAW760]|eukprot:EDR27696.1 hypothetical protein EDI_163080 [Entamoeba dispar SAW760]